MSETRTDDDADESTGHSTESVRYGTNHVVAVIDRADQLTPAARAPKDGGCLPREYGAHFVSFPGRFAVEELRR